MKKITILMMLILAAIIPAAAQQKGKDRETMRKEVHEFKLKYLAQEMDLKEDQQKKFFDLYNQMCDEKIKVFRETRQLENRLAKTSDASESEYEAVTKAITAAKEKDAEIEKRYDEKFAKFLTPKQIFKMKEAEGKFRDKMREMRHKKRHSKK